MRKGFIETLATVAIAMLGYNAMAVAPTVGDIPDIIVGDAEHSSENNVFVFEDAFNLDDYVTDDETPAENIIWSYGQFDEENRYTFNGVDPVDGSSQAVLPGNRIDTQDDDPLEQDGNSRTVTIRDELRSPVAEGGGLGPYPDPAGGPGELPDSRTIVLFASDGSTVGEGSFIIYSEDDGEDGFSPREEIVLDLDFRTGDHGWTFAEAIGTVNESQDDENGLCLETPLTGDNDASWISPYGAVELVPNSVWEARMTVSTSQTTAFETPTWMFVYDNFGDGQGQNEYGGQMFYHDNEQGANSPIDGVGRSDFRMLMAPISFQVPHFLDETNGFFNPGLDDNRDMRLHFRIFDLASASYHDGRDEGAICFQDLTVVRHDIATMQNLETVFEVTSFEDANTGDAGNSGPNGYQIDGPGTDIDFSGGNITLSSNGNAWDGDTVTLLRPGDGRDFNPTNDNGELNDLFPIEWEENTLYYIEFELSAPTEDDENNPPDAIRVGADVLTSELIMDHVAVPNTPDASGTATRGLSMPRTGDPQKFAAFFYSHSQTATDGINDALRWRPRFEVLTDDALQPIGRADNTGDVRVHSVSVQKVQF